MMHGRALLLATAGHNAAPQQKAQQGKSCQISSVSKRASLASVCRSESVSVGFLCYYLLLCTDELCLFHYPRTLRKLAVYLPAMERSKHQVLPRFALCLHAARSSPPCQMSSACVPPSTVEMTRSLCCGELVQQRPAVLCAGEAEGICHDVH